MQGKFLVRRSLDGGPIEVGHYDERGDWRKESEHPTVAHGAMQVRFLNGGNVLSDMDNVTLLQIAHMAEAAYHVTGAKREALLAQIHIQFHMLPNELRSNH